MPQEIGQLEKLENLNLASTQVTTLPVEIEQLKKLKSLSLPYTFPQEEIDKIRKLLPKCNIQK